VLLVVIAGVYDVHSRSVTWPVFFLILACVAIPYAISTWRRDSRRGLLARLRNDWGKPGRRIHKMELIAEISQSRLANTAHASPLDGRTWSDLGLDDVFAAIDRTESTLGQQALYHRLRTAPAGEHMEAFEALVARMTNDTAARERAQMALARLQDSHGYDIWWLAQADAVEVRAWYAVFPLLTVLTVAMILLTVWSHSFGLFLVALLGFDLGLRLLAGSSMNALGKALRQIAPIVATGEELAFLQGRDIAPITGPLLSDVPHLRRLKTIARWLSDDPLMTPSWDGLAMVVGAVLKAVYEYVNMVLLLDANGVYFGSSDLRAHSGSLLRLTSAIGDVDAAISVASWRAERDDWTRPDIGSSDSTAVLAGVRHPLLDTAIPNTIELTPGRGVLVTGSNMSGKSTFIRAVGVNTVLAQTINTCIATRYRAPLFHVRSCIGREDDLLAGKSYYIVEVESMLALVRASASNAPHLFLCDELFRGTNAVERIGAAEAVLTELVLNDGRAKPHVVVAATHDGELVDLLRERYDAYHFADRLGDDGLIFEYRLQAGPATTRNAIALLKQHGAPDTLVNRALARTAALDRQRAASGVAGQPHHSAGEIL